MTKIRLRTNSERSFLFFDFSRSVILKTWEYRCPKAAGSYPTSGSPRLSVGCFSDVSRTFALLKTFTSTAPACFCQA